MKPAAVMEAPADAGSVSANPELIAHEWDSSGAPNGGYCLNPEEVVVDFGKKAGGRLAVFRLGVREDGTWRVGWHIVTKDTNVHLEPCTATGTDFKERAFALRFGLQVAQKYFEGDRAAMQTLSAIFAKTLPQSLPANGDEPRNAATAVSRPMPAAVAMEIPIATIQRNPQQPRKDFPADKEQELADSIASVGLLQRIVVRKLLPDELGELPGMEGQDRYELVAGERRMRAHLRLERTTIAAEVYSGITRDQAAAAALVENLQREGLNPIEEAEGFRDLMVKEGLTQEQCAQRVGVSRPVVANALRVLELPEKVIGLVREGKLTLAHGTALARFKEFPKHVGIMAEWAVTNRATASQLEKGVPACSDLMRAGLARRIDAWAFDNELPSELKKGAAIFKQDDYSSVCLDVALYDRLVAEQEAEKKKEQAAAAERERKKAEAAAKNPKKIKSLADLPRNSYVEVTSDERKELLGLVPDEAQLELKDGGDKVTVCTEPDLFSKIQAEVNKLKVEDRKAKWTKVIVETLNAIAKTKKIGPRETMLLLYLASLQGEVYPGPQLCEKYEKLCGVKLPKKAMGEHYEGQIDFSPKSLALLVTEPGPVDLYRLLMDSWVREHENEVVDKKYDISPDSDLGTICKWILERDELGFIEETKVGQKQLSESVKSLEWYQRAIAKIEGREYVAPAAPASLKKVAADEAKAAKKGRK